MATGGAAQYHGDAAIRGDVMVKRARLLLLCMFGMFLATGSAVAQTAGFSFATEGGFAFRSAEPMTPFTYQPATMTEPNGPNPQWLVPDLANRVSGYGRLELAGTAVGPGGGFVRLSAVAAGWVGFNRIQPDAWGATTCRFDPEDVEHRVCHGQICRPGANEVPCVFPFGGLLEAYAEVMPGIAIGHTMGRSAFVSIGAQAFYGVILERGFAGVTNLSADGNAFTDSIDGRALGVLGTTELSVPLGPRTRMTLSGGAGSYAITAASLISQFSIADGVPATPSDTPDSVAIQGFRFQGGIGVSRQIGRNVEVGLMARTDYWTAFPRMAWIAVGPSICDTKSDNEGTHSVSHCQVAKPEGMHELTVAPLFQASVGFRLTVHFGG